MSDKPKVVEIDGFLYSKGPFEGYNSKAKIQLRLRTGKSVLTDTYSIITLYTTNKASDRVLAAVESNVENIVRSEIVSFISREIYELQDKIIDEFLSKGNLK